MKQKLGLITLLAFLLPLSGFAQQDQQEQMRREMERMQEEMNRFFEGFKMPEMPEDGFMRIDTFFFHQLDPAAPGEWPFSEEAFPGDLNRMLQDLMRQLPGWQEGQDPEEWNQLFKGFGTPFPFPDELLPRDREQKPAAKKRRTYTL
jgi:hypothetical protein